MAPDRFWGLARISLWNIDHAIEELQRCKQAGLRGVAIGVTPAVELLYSAEHYERFWAACSDLNMSLNFHILSGPGKASSEARFDRGLLPLGAGWIPFFAQEFDYYQNSVFGEPWRLPLLPSEYIYRQVYGAFISDQVGGHLLSQYGQENFMWSNDYPHGACIWPLTAEVIARDLGHLAPEARFKVTAGNAARLYNQGVLPPPADPPGEVQDLTSWEAHWRT